MPLKRIGNKLWKRITSIENLREAHRRARQDKAYYTDVKMVDEDPDKFLYEIQRMLIHHQYEVSEYIIQLINDKGKERTLMKLKYFPDRIIQWAIMLQLEPVFMSVFCNHTCASIPNRGIKCATRLIKEYLKDKKGTKYCLKMDVRKFYDTVNHKILKTLLRKKIKDKETLALLDLIIDSYPGDIGLPIGSYLSQYLANYYLAYFDHWLKEECGVKYVVRYMDDVVIFAETKEELHDLFAKIEEYLAENLELEIKGNHQVFSVNVRGVDFIGYRYFRNFILLRKGTYKRMRRVFNRILDKQLKGQLINHKEWSAANSYIGWMIWCDSWNLFEKYVEPVKGSVVLYYRNVICKKAHKDDKKAQVVSFNRYVRKLNRKKGRCAA